MIKIEKIQKQQLTSNFNISTQFINIEYVLSFEDLINQIYHSNHVSDDAIYQLIIGNESVGVLYVYNTSQPCVFFTLYITEINFISVAEMIFHISEFIFDNFNALKISCELVSDNKNYIETHMKNGFEQEGYFKHHIVVKSKLKDIVRLSCQRSNYNKYLKKYLSKVYIGDKFSINIGDEYIEEVVYNNESISNYAQLTGDTNPIHLDEEYAKNIGFKKNIVHGMLSASIFSKILATDFPGAGSIYITQDLNFIKPIYPNDQLLVSLKVLSIIGSKITIATQIESNGLLVIMGTTKVINTDRVKK